MDDAGARGLLGGIPGYAAGMHADWLGEAHPENGGGARAGCLGEASVDGATCETYDVGARAACLGEACNSGATCATAAPEADATLCAEGTEASLCTEGAETSLCTCATVGVGR